ncbi:MAG: tetratricopeptide repeat protein [Candidatus Omnitrophota bacterium]
MKRPIILVIALIAGIGLIGQRSESVTDISRSDVSSLWSRIFKWVRAEEQAREGKAFSHYIMGVLYDNEGELDKAIEEYAKALANEKEEVSRIHMRLAIDHLLTRNQEKAVEHLVIAKNLDSENSKARFLLALIYTSDGKFDAAQNEYEEVIQFDPDDLRALANLADLLVVQEKVAEAAYVYERLIEKGEDSYLLHFNLGVIYFRIGRLDDAITELKQAAAMKGDYAEAYIGLAMLYETKEDLPAAVEQYEKVLKVDPLNIKAYYSLGRIYAVMGKPSDAVHQYELLIALNPGKLDPYVEWANIYLKQKKAVEAVSVLEKAVEAGIVDPDLFLALGFSAAQAKQDEKALGNYWRAVELNPDDAKAHFYLGSFYERRKKKDLAIKEFREAIRLDASFAEAYNYLGYLFVEGGENLDEAIFLIRKALEIEPNNGAYVDSLGWGYFRKGMVDEAIEQLDRAVTLEPNDAVIRDHMGDAYFKKGLFKKAQVHWERSLEIDPSQEEVREKLDRMNENGTKER